MDPDGGNFLTLHTFTGGTDGQDPQAQLFEANDTFLYGTTVFGGASNGTAYKLRKDGRTYSTFHSFASSEGTDRMPP